MSVGFPLFPDSASTHAPTVDYLYFFLLGLSGFFTILIAGLIVYFANKYRRRSEDELPPQYRPSLWLEVVWIVIPSLIVVAIFLWGALLFLRLHRVPEDTLDIYGVGKQWMWKLQHPQGQRETNQLHVPLGRNIRLYLTSEDVIHSFFVPAFRVKQDVLADRYTTLWFQPSRLGRYHLFCAEYCGTWHSSMRGEIVVVTPEEYQHWLAANVDGAPAERGQQLFRQLQCIACHTGAADARAPLLENLHGTQVPLQDGFFVTADDDYIRESILRPKAKIVAGYQPIMPTYEGQISAEELVDLTLFLRTLGSGASPPRVERTPPPSQADLDRQERMAP